jgi:hypothetical protein
MSGQPDYYGALGLTKTATHEEIRKAYRQLAMKWHPGNCFVLFCFFVWFGLVWFGLNFIQHQTLFTFPTFHCSPLPLLI